jgi:hypothetical protein
VLPDRIELSTSPLPMECSTTELRQHARDRDRIGPKGPPTGGPVLATSPPLAQARGNPKKAPKWGESAGASAACGLPELGKLRPDPVLRLFRQRHERFGSADTRPRMRSFRRLHHVFRRQWSPRAAIGRGDRAVPAVEGLLWPRTPGHIFAHRRFFADDGIKTGPR